MAVPAYRQEPDVDPHSQTETYVAMKLHVDNWRWAGVPIYIRTGKRLPKRVTEVALQFQGVPHLAFNKGESRDLRPNALVLRIQPDEGVSLRFGAKVPGQAFRVRDVLMDMSYGTSFLEEAPDAYERLLLDAMVGDPTLFIRSDEVDQAWQIVAADPHDLGGSVRPAGRLRRRHMGSPPGRPADPARRAPVADAVAVDTWDARGVRLADVTAALAALRHQSRERAALRTTVMTLVAIAPGDERAYSAMGALRTLGGHHPARIVLIRPDPDEVATLDGRATLYAVAADGHPLHFEEVILACGRPGRPPPRLAGRSIHALRPARVVWYVGSVPDPTDPLLTLATAVLTDSRDAADTGQLRTLLELARRRTVVDLSWIRLEPWRDLLAGLFDPPAARPWARRCESGRGHRQDRPSPTAGRLAGAGVRPDPSAGANGGRPPRRTAGDVPPRRRIGAVRSGAGRRAADSFGRGRASDRALAPPVDRAG